ncbi:MAG: transporter, partial [Silvibacterium sp.]
MHKLSSFPRSAFAWTAALALALLIPAPRAHAVSKEMIQLQEQVQQLQDALQHLQETNDTRMALLQHLVEQTADNVNRITQSMTSLQQQVTSDSQNNQISGQIQSLNDSVDEMKTRITQVNKTLQDLQSQI